jgi:glucuronate isomerase
MNNDIVARLRSTGGLDARLLCDAADEIERLREELTASHESHGNEVGSLTERLSLAIHERDEARREICDWISEGREDPKVIAQRYRWDCFKENGK